MNIWIAAILIIGLLAANAFFVAAEFALVSSRKDRLESLIAQGKKGAQRPLAAIESLSLYLAGSQFGITIASLILGKVAEPAIAHFLEGPFTSIGVPEQLLHPLSFVLALLIITVLHIIFGEMVPKNIAIAGPETMAVWLTPMMDVWVKLTRPVIRGINEIARWTLKLFGIEQRDELDSTVDQDQLRDMIRESNQEGLLDAEETVRLANALGSESRSLKEVMIPLDELVTLPYAAKGIPLSVLENAVRETGFSRFPVEGSAGGLLGYIHVKDVLDLLHSEGEVPGSAADPLIPFHRIRRLSIVDGKGSLDDALTSMHRRSAHMAQVREDGELVGVLALEDIIEEYVGTVSDWTHEEH
ncbi:hemolysin family protein [Corynebacterium aquatimens]|uniref:CBS domain containing-hemolysin-like protein n=1 Tax=Corynebacterium aquatimens TaxID=1190508 RepID=A0A931DWU4_9CORY|nr:hemolysin family protein [Corynebacterium aquatimens]MBG6121565.1 CBS domain containing-hemolysin-like protein [Corynebacterium aquatimens]WJY65895.1 Magnesium and cobalt efflux protein CorC [Corynebacterium aquatimens]